jgi:two-component system KDP operon response regulator KdpE
MRKQRVLVVDDEPETIKFVGANLRARGYEALVAEDGRAALKLAHETVLDLVILDIVLPGINGFDVCRALRQCTRAPIIMLSARGHEKDVVQALDLGADDYLTKPFGVEELLARVRAVLRRSQGAAAPQAERTVGDLSLDFANRQVLLANSEVRLTATEYALLAELALNAGRVMTHQALLQAVWGPAYRDEIEYLWAYIRRLRRKIEPDPSRPRYILTQPGVGYWFAAPHEIKA